MSFLRTNFFYRPIGLNIVMTKRQRYNKVNKPRPISKFRLIGTLEGGNKSCKQCLGVKNFKTFSNKHSVSFSRLVVNSAGLRVVGTVRS